MMVFQMVYQYQIKLANAYITNLDASSKGLLCDSLIYFYYPPLNRSYKLNSRIIPPSVHRTLLKLLIQRQLLITPNNASLSCRLIDPPLVIIASLQPESMIFGIFTMVLSIPFFPLFKAPKLACSKLTFSTPNVSFLLKQR